MLRMKAHQINKIDNINDANPKNLPPTMYKHSKSSNRAIFSDFQVRNVIDSDLLSFTKKVSRRSRITSHRTHTYIKRISQRYLAINILLLVIGYVMGRNVEALDGGFNSSTTTKLSTSEERNEIESSDGPLQIGDHYEIVISSDPNISQIKPDISEDGKTSIYILQHENASFLSVHFADMDLPDSCSLIIQRSDTNQVERLTHTGRLNLRSFWGHHTSGDIMVIVFHCDEFDDIEHATFLIDDYVAGHPTNQIRNQDDRYLRSSQSEDINLPFAVRDLSICKADNKKNAVCYKGSHRDRYDKVRPVARLFINGSGTCTGWLVKSPDGNVLLTNKHCIRSQSDAVNTDYEFMAEGNQCNGSTSFLSDSGPIFDGEKLLVSETAHDFSLIQLKGNPGRTYGELEIDNREPQVGESIFIPQHPRGFPKQIAMHDDNYNDGECRVLVSRGYTCKGGKGDMRYSCDTEAGSSGSPVISSQTLKVIGLHHCGGGCSGNMAVPVVNFFNEINSSLINTNRNIIEEGCVRFGDKVTLELGDVPGKWLTGGRGGGGDLVQTMAFNKTKQYKFKFAVRSESGNGSTRYVDPKSGQCVKYNNKVFLQISNTSNRWLTGGRESEKNVVETRDFTDINESKVEWSYRWTMRSESTNGDRSIKDVKTKKDVMYGDEILLQVNHLENRWLAGAIGKQKTRVLARGFNEKKSNQYKWIIGR